MVEINTLSFILGEIIFVLVVLSTVLCLVSWKLKKALNEMQHQYKELRKRTRHILSELNFADNNDIPESLHGDTVGIFLHSIAQYSLDRFKKFAPGGVPVLSADLPFSAKVAALRYLYAMTEAENRIKQNTPENWQLLEKKSADIVRWVRNIDKQQNAAGGRIKQLHEKIDQLKKHEMENVRLKRQVTLTREKNRRLEDQNKNQRDNIRKLQTLMNAIQRSLPESAALPMPLNANEATDVQPRHKRASIAYEGSLFQISNISDITQRKQALLTTISDNLNDSLSRFDKNERSQFEEKVKALEVDILKSDHHITQLQKELKLARDNIHQLKALESQPQESPSEKPKEAEDMQAPTLAGEPTTGGLATVAADDPEAAAVEPLESWITDGGHERTLEEIEKLRSNNQNQRKLILELNLEINQLRESMSNTDDETLKAEKTQEIVKLERLVKECEYCIETLESEVDLLRDQMTDEQEKEQHPDIEKLNRDIEAMTAQLQQTIDQYSHAHVINQFATRLLECTDIESIAELLVSTLNSMNLNHGFYLDGSLGQIEHHSDGKATLEEQKTLKMSEGTSHVGYTNDGILFFRTHARLLIKTPPEDDDAQALLEATLNTLTQLVNSSISHLEARQKNYRHDEALKESVIQVKSSLKQINERYQSQSMEIKKILADFTAEVEASVKLMNPSPAVKAVFENAISESSQRMDILLNESKAIEKYIQEIIKALAQGGNQ